jgi:hypothetical protein
MANPRRTAITVFTQRQFTDFQEHPYCITKAVKDLFDCGNACAPQTRSSSRHPEQTPESVLATHS